MASVSVTVSGGGVAFVSVAVSRGGVAFVTVNLSKGGVASHFSKRTLFFFYFSWNAVYPVAQGT